MTTLIFEQHFIQKIIVSPKVAIVILNWNGRNYLQQFLPSVLQSSYDNKEVIVADNASTDDSVQFVQQNFPQVKIISLQKNFGFAQGYNEALKSVQSEYYVLLNSDVEVGAGWIEPVIELMEKNKTIGAAQPKILSYTNKELFEYAGAAGGWIDYLGYPFARGRVFDTCEKDEGQYDDAVAVFWASGAAMFVRSDAYKKLNGLDNYFFAHMEEIDFCWRLQLAGYSVYACPQSKVYHVGAGTLKKDSKKKIFLNFRNNLIMLAKNLPLSQSIWKIPLRVLLDVVSAFKFLFSGQPVYFLAILKAHFAFIYWVLFKRKESVFSGAIKIKPPGWFDQSVVWKYFISGKKTFAEIVKGKN
jgi:GT2 family glycosyltransferase